MKLRGKPLADMIFEKQIPIIRALSKRGIVPKIAVIRAMNDEPSIRYFESIKRKFERYGCECFAIYKNLESTADLKEELEKLNEDESIHGVLIQRPLPKTVDIIEAIRVLSPYKDIEGLTPYNLARLLVNEELFIPCTAEAVIRLLEYYDVRLESRRVVVLGRSISVGKPLSLMFLNRNATVTICHSRTEDITSISREADILVSSVGIARFVDASMVKKGGVVVDVGMNSENGKLVGDVNYEEVKDIASKITPVPGGVGPVTVAILFENLIKAAEMRDHA